MRSLCLLAVLGLCYHQAVNKKDTETQASAWTTSVVPLQEGEGALDQTRAGQHPHLLAETSFAGPAAPSLHRCRNDLRVVEMPLLLGNLQSVCQQLQSLRCQLERLCRSGLRASRTSSRTTRGSRMEKPETPLYIQASKTEVSPDTMVQGTARARPLAQTRARARAKRKENSRARGSLFKKKAKMHLPDLQRTVRVRANCSLRNPLGPQPMPVLLIGHHYHLQLHRLLRRCRTSPDALHLRNEEAAGTRAGEPDTVAGGHGPECAHGGGSESDGPALCRSLRPWIRSRSIGSGPSGSTPTSCTLEGLPHHSSGSMARVYQGLSSGGAIVHGGHRESQICSRCCQGILRQQQVQGGGRIQTA